MGAQCAPTSKFQGAEINIRGRIFFSTGPPLEILLGPKFCISASTEATEMYNLSNFLFLRDQFIGAVFDYPKEIFYALFIENMTIF